MALRQITYRVSYQSPVLGSVDEEEVTVLARDINSGYSKALRRAQEPLGNGTVRKIVRITFWQSA